MADSARLGDAILLRLVDRIMVVEQQTASNAAAITMITNGMDDLHRSMAELTHDVDEMRNLSASALKTFEDMRKPLQGLLELRQKFTGGWLLATALVMVAAYLFQPLLSQIYHLHLTGP